ncbi:HEAT repeat domain-containing protein [Actinotalea solisilvae]|uniref:HEAT repeat domain-containing protein n=1 Tax=Actinotalea solisilvae TaxID=2072922 RepID=UPI0018F24831|nr:HEAT repeat domain-containing protein [Actinotalea solisilvae]
MTRAQEYRDALLSLPVDRRPAYLTEHSGLPGPRANLELAQVMAELADPPSIDALIATGDEYLVLCGVVGLGRLLADGAGEDVERRLHGHAGDARWRVHEAVAMALQRLGDGDPVRLLRLCATWAGDPDPLVQRAAVAGVCEPRLLHVPDVARAAVDLCDRLTTSLAARPPAERRRSDVRVLRQGLGYCWSVAVAGDPERGLPRFLALASSSDRDVAWIVRENRRKARLARLL